MPSRREFGQMIQVFAQCPRCTSRRTRPSRTRSTMDLIVSLFGRSPFRCRSCCLRFYCKPTESLGSNFSKEQAGSLVSETNGSFSEPKQ
jgi:hypothetical protein